MKYIEFTKMVASGNDFVVINGGLRLSVSGLRDFAKAICDRQYGVGGDGLLVLEKSNAADFKMRIFNPDGSEAEMCGNGARCIALYAIQNRIAGRSMKFETLAGIIEAHISGEQIKLKMSEPKDLRLDINLVISDKNYNANFVDTGVPHTVIFVDDVGARDIKETGREIRYHRAFAPKGTNVNFVEAQKGNLLKVRTYERGVEDETLACGTGVTASAIIAATLKGLKNPVTCVTKSGDKLKIYFKRAGGNFKDVYLEGTAKVVFCGRYSLK